MYVVKKWYNANNSQRNCSNNNSSNHNATNVSTNNSVSNELNQMNLPSGVNNEMVAGIIHANNDPINVSGEDVMRSQVQTSIVKNSLPQNNIISTTNTPPFSTMGPWGMPPISNEMNIPQLSLPMPQSQNSIPPIVVSRQTNKLLELGGNSHSYDVD